MDTKDEGECCPRFNPEPWDEKVITWKNKPFIQDHVTSIFHIPLNYTAVMTRNFNAIRAANAGSPRGIVLTDENSLWGADVYFEVSQDFPNTRMVTLSGKFLCKVFEGPFRNIKKWIDEMNAYVTKKAEHPIKMYFYYTTCPKCAKKYGKNYVVILAEVTSA
jgi:hypothetical protein